MNKQDTSYQECMRCIMDTGDPEISFNAEGICNHCRDFDLVAKDQWFPNEEGKQLLADILGKIKKAGQTREYDCILGLSGGVDSSYLALKAYDWGLRPLVVHVDAGWNAELAVANIEAIVKYCGYDLHTHVVDWEEMRDLQLAYLRSGIANQDIPQDHIFFASLYHFAIRNNIRYVLSGGNLATEAIFPKAWHNDAMDAVNLKAIHKKFGSRPLRNYKTISFFEYYIWYPLMRSMRTVRPLNYMPYNKDMALEELKQLVEYKPYKRKHGESLFTRLFQNHILPRRFGYDKRRPHLSSLIVSGQLSKQEALEKLAEPLYEAHELEQDIAYFCKKLGISREEFEDFLMAPLRYYTDFPNYDGYYRFLKAVQQTMMRITGRKFRVYS